MKQQARADNDADEPWHGRVAAAQAGTNQVLIGSVD